MAVQTLNPSFPTLSALDQQTLALLISMKDDPEVQKDEALLKMFSNAVSFMTSTGFSSAMLPTCSIPQPLAMPPVSEPPLFPLVPFIQIETNGEDGDHGCLAPPSSGYGINGTDGSDGGNARDINLTLTVKDQTIAAQWDNDSASMKLDNTAASIFLRATGGRGGRGGDGGRGGAGTQGARGRDADRYSKGEDGGRGGAGRLGGNGGDGGNGGKGGNIKVAVSPEDADLLMFLKSPEVTGGARGKGGAKGKGGVGGKGGEGGSGHHFSVMRTGTRTVYNGRLSSTQTYTYTVPDYNPGGSTGPKGPDGDDGRVGSDGKSGINGSFQMIVGGISYQSLYDLAITVSKAVDLSQGNPSDIYEPGEQIHLMVSAFNTGGMPTPSQDIEISLRTAPWLEPETSSLVLANPLPIERSHTFSTPFSFRVKDQYPVSEEPLHKTETLTYQALLRRVNKTFPRVNQQKDVFTVRYPIQLTPLQGKTSIGFDEPSIVNLFVQNVSSIIMGKEGPQKRRVFVTFEIAQLENLKANDIEFLKTAERDLQESHKITHEVNQLSPKSDEKIAISLRFTNPALRAHSKVLLVASLHLGYLKKDEQLDLTRCIQKSSMQIEFRENNQPTSLEVLDHPLGD
jgi:hypothetical protein